MNAQTIICLVPILGVIALLFTFFKSAWVAKQDPGSERMIRIAKDIDEGAMAFLKAEYSILALFVLAIAIILFFTNALTAVAFIVGALCSAGAGFIGMRVATKANVRTANAAISSLGEALNIAFSGGSVMGMGVVGLGILGLSSLFGLFVLANGHAPDEISLVLEGITGFSFGASSIALFARVGGGIYTKAADVGADLVGKVEAGIPEDHPLNPATIADNVGDNVGDVAGMGADLFESYVGSILGTMVLGAAFIGLQGFETDGALWGINAILLPLVLAGVGIIASIIGTFFVKVGPNGNPHRALNIGEIVAAVLMLIATYFIIMVMLPESWELGGVNYSASGVFWALIFGLFSGLAIGKITEHYTGTGTGPVISIVKQSVTGSATNIIAGLGVGMISTAWPIVILATAMIAAYSMAGFYGVAIAAVGMLSNTGIQLAVDAYGPISDNAGGIAEMANLPAEVRRRTDMLDAVGNTTAAIGKGFAIGSAALTAIVLFAAFRTVYNETHETTPLTGIDITNPYVMGALLIGAMLPFLFSALAMQAVGRAAMAMIEEVRRQFKDIPELKAALSVMSKNGEADFDQWDKDDQDIYVAAEGKAEYDKCVAISTQASIREMIIPGLLAVTTPVLFGFGTKLFSGGNTNALMLGGLLAGVTASGVLMALFQSNAGGAWDNAKKMIEAGYDNEGTELKKGSEAHKAAVTGDTVGDPFKDTSGPSLNILLKLMSVVALVIAPYI
jgi:K(+)-stimulated pyrophosphate-energized sodium pump